MYLFRLSRNASIIIHYQEMDTTMCPIDAPHSNSTHNLANELLAEECV